MTVSVVIPARNDADMLARCLDRLAAQTRAADEIIVVDNGSADNTAEVARAAGATVIAEPVQGITRATAAGFDHATGSILARLDADSAPPSDWIERVAHELESSDRYVAVTGPGRYYDGHRITRYLGRVLYLGGYFATIGLYLGHPPLYGSNFALRRDAWLRVAPLIHRDVREVHDDLEISLHLGPDMDVKYLRDLVMPISARPFESFEGLARRVRWGFGTLALDRRERDIPRLRERHDWKVEQVELAAARRRKLAETPSEHDVDAESLGGDYDELDGGAASAY